MEPSTAAYLKEMGARSYDCLPGSGYDIDPLGACYVDQGCKELGTKLKENYSDSNADAMINMRR